jgi:hypothetical protein
MQAELSGSGIVGPAHFINSGLRLERDQCVKYALVQYFLSLISSIRFKILAMVSNKKPTRTQSEAILKARLKLQLDLVAWRQSQFEFCPLLRPSINAVDPTSPEREKLLLPSSFNQVLRKRFDLTSLAVIEYQLREGQAYDALHDLRERIKIFNANLDFKKKNVFGQGPNTRAQAFLKQLTADKVNAADKYRIAYRALICLGKAETELQELRDDQLFGKDASRPAKLGDSRQEDPWFWTVGRLHAAEDQAEWSLECRPSSYSFSLSYKSHNFSLAVDRVKYFRDRSARNRAREEKEILEFEMARTTRSFDVMQTAWNEIGRREHENSRHSYSAYAYKQAALYERLASDSKEFEGKAEKKRLVYEHWYDLETIAL